MTLSSINVNPWFNTQLLKLTRSKLGWTQVELARKAHLSVRVIAKAEAGNRVGKSTVQAIVRAFQEAGSEISGVDLTCDPRGLVQEFFCVCNTFKTNAVIQSRGLLTSNVQLHVDGDPVNNPLAGTYRGIEELEAFLCKYHGIFVRDGGTLGDLTQMRVFDQEVIAWGHEFIRVPEAPPSLPTFKFFKIRINQGLITRIYSYYDAAGLMSRLEGWAKAYPQSNWIRYLTSNRN
jgi:transcriptional regulator with XRE-family HTH domain